MPFYPPQATAPPNPLPEWLQDLFRTGRDWGGGAHVPSLALKAATAMLPEAGSKWAAGEYEPGQAIPPGDWMPDVVGGAAPGAGMVRWRKGMEYPEAYLHRAIGGLSELDWWDKIFKRGLTTEKPTSMVTPGFLSTFQNNPGLMFDVTRPKQIRWATPFDMGSLGYDLPMPNQYLTAYREAEKAIRRKNVPPRPEYPTLPRTPEGSLDYELYSSPKFAEKHDKAMQEYRQLDREYQEALPLYNKRRDALWDRVHGAWKRGAPEKWDAPTGAFADLLLPQYTKNTREAVLAGKTLTPRDYETLTGFFDKQRKATREYEALAGAPVDPMLLSHNEIIPRVGRNSLAGVRLEPDSPGHEGINRRLREFAESYEVPVFSWPSRFSRGQQEYMAKYPLAGKWTSGPEGTTTSSELDRILRSAPGLYPRANPHGLEKIIHGDWLNELEDLF